MNKYDFNLEVQTDPETGMVQAAYLRIRRGEVDETVELADGRAYADYDAAGLLLGVEMLAPCDIKVLDSVAKEESGPVKAFFQSTPPRAMVLT